MSKSQKKAIAPSAKQPAAKVAKGKETENPARNAKPVGKAASAKGAGRSGSKQSVLITLLERTGGATVDEMAKATGWQNHSVLGAISGVLKKRLGLTVASERQERGRVYRIAGKR